MKGKRWLIFSLVVVLIASLALAACQPPAEEVPAEEAPAEEAPAEEAPAEEAPAEEAPAEETPVVGGTLVYVNVEEPDTLDIYKSGFAISSIVTSYIGSALVAKDADGQMVPSLAESWEISEDNLTYTFHLRQDVKFHNGEPFTAHDYVWTWDRCLAEDFVSPVSASMLAPFVSYEATDDYTLVLTLAEPSFYTLSNLGASDYLQPLNKTAVEAAGDNYGLGTTAVGVGPFMVKEWIQDEKIVLTRNPDYNWGPELFEGSNTGPRNVENFEIRILPDNATILAGMETNELGLASVKAKDLQTVRDTGYYQVFDILPTNITYVQFNHQSPKFADLKVRQALNLAIDKETILQVVQSGQGVVADGPLSPAMVGYDEATMKGSGYGFDLDAAKALMEEAGYTYGDDNMLLTPEGEPFAFTLLTRADEQSTKLTTVLVDMWRALGVDVTIEQLEWGTMAPLVFAGEYEVCTMGIAWPDADVLHMAFHSSNIGGINFAYYSNPELDELLVQARTEVDPAAYQETVNAVFKLIVDEALMVPLFTPVSFLALNNDFQGAVISPFIGLIETDLYYVGD